MTGVNQDGCTVGVRVRVWVRETDVGNSYYEHRKKLSEWR